MPFVSVVVPCYKAKEYVTATLHALEAQTYRDFEVILVDDCSPDGTYEFLLETVKNYTVPMRVVKNPVNTGPAGARNLGTSVSEASYIAFCDSDDTYTPDFLAKMVASATASDADMVFCNHKKVTPEGDEIAKTAFPEGFAGANASKKEILALDADSLCTLLIRREIVASIPQPELRNGEDMAVIPLMIMKSERFAFWDDCLYNYVCRPGSLSLSASEGVVRSLEASFAHILAHKPEGFETEIEYLGIRNLIYGALLNHFKYTKDKKKPREILDSFEKSYPAWRKNPYIADMPARKRLFLSFAKRRFFLGIRLLAYLHKRLTEKR